MNYHDKQNTNVRSFSNELIQFISNSLRVRIYRIAFAFEYQFPISSDIPVIASKVAISPNQMDFVVLSKVLKREVSLQVINQREKIILAILKRHLVNKQRNVDEVSFHIQLFP